jgi:hypothetical protein
LAWVTARARGKAEVYVLFVAPEGAPAAWEHTSYWPSARAIPGVQVRADLGGVETRRFGATTSGHVILYDPRGHLLYRGGITVGRGHEGDNPGRRAVVAYLQGERAEAARLPVFGCPLLDAE